MTTMLFKLSEQWQLERDINYYSAHNFATRVSLAQCTMAIMAMESESPWAFQRAVLPMNTEVGLSSNGGRREDKSAHNSTTKVKFSTDSYVSVST